MIDIKKMTATIAMAADRMEELSKLRAAGKLTPEYEESMMESVFATLQDIQTKIGIPHTDDRHKQEVDDG